MLVVVRRVLRGVVRLSVFFFQIDDIGAGKAARVSEMRDEARVDAECTVNFRVFFLFLVFSSCFAADDDTQSITFCRVPTLASNRETLIDSRFSLRVTLVEHIFRFLGNSFGPTSRIALLK